MPSRSRSRFRQLLIYFFSLLYLYVICLHLRFFCFRVNNILFFRRICDSTFIDILFRFFVNFRTTDNFRSIYADSSFMINIRLSLPMTASGKYSISPFFPVSPLHMPIGNRVYGKRLFLINWHVSYLVRLKQQGRLYA